MARGPIRQNANNCIESKPDNRSVLFCHQFISLSAVSLSTGISVSFLSRMFSGKRQPSVPTAKKLAKALAMELGTFLKALEEHQAIISMVVPVPPELSPAPVATELPVEKAS